MSLSGHKTGLITLHDTASGRRKLRRCVSVSHGSGAPKQQVGIPSITFSENRIWETPFCVVIQFPNGKGLPVTARPMTEKETTIQPMERTMKDRKIPKTDSIEELARFWDTHDLTDFEDQLEDISEPIFERKRETVIPVRLRRHEVEAVKRVAKTRGVREAALLRQWVREKLQDAKS